MLKWTIFLCDNSWRHMWSMDAYLSLDHFSAFTFSSVFVPSNGIVLYLLLTL